MFIRSGSLIQITVLGQCWGTAKQNTWDILAPISLPRIHLLFGAMPVSVRICGSKFPSFQLLSLRSVEPTLIFPGSNTLAVLPIRFSLPTSVELLRMQRYLLYTSWSRWLEDLPPSNRSPVHTLLPRVPMPIGCSFLTAVRRAHGSGIKPLALKICSPPHPWLS